MITADGRGVVSEDPEGKDFPWHPKSLYELVKGKLVNNAGEVKDFDANVKGTVFGLYFSAHWVRASWFVASMSVCVTMCVSVCHHVCQCVLPVCQCVSPCVSECVIMYVSVCHYVSLCVSPCVPLCVSLCVPLCVSPCVSQCVSVCSSCVCSAVRWRGHIRYLVSQLITLCSPE